MKMSRKKGSATIKDLFVNLAVAFCALVILFVALELSLRVGGWLYSFYERSHTQCLSARSPGDLSTQTILCVGDSFTQGAGAGPRESYPQQLESILLRTGFRDVRTINQGVGGITSSIALKKMPKLLATYKPKIVLLLIGCNDFWNLEDSNYFFLYQSRIPFAASVQQMLNKSKLYKLLKIALVNISDKLARLKRNSGEAVPSRSALGKVNALSAELFCQGEWEMFYGRDASAIEKFKRALAADPKNYLAAYWVGERYCALNEKERAREYLWQAISGCNDWNEDFLSKISNVAWRLDDQPLVTFMKVRAYLVSKYDKDTVRPALRFIDAQIAVINREEVFDAVLRYNLKEIADLAKERHIALIFLSYPSPKKISAVIREAAAKNNVLLVDSEKVFVEKLRTARTADYFVSDGHCNGRGYLVMAQSVAEAILKNHLLEGKNGNARQ
jgi:lysophospholipase L1-like esterase